MNLMRSICCLFGDRCEEEEPKPTKDTMRDEPSADLGQKEAKLEKTGKEQMAIWKVATPAKPPNVAYEDPLTST
jgi:hypothetical protein